MALAYAVIDEDGVVYGGPELGLDGIDFPFVPQSGHFSGPATHDVREAPGRLRVRHVDLDVEGVYRGCFATSEVAELLDMISPQH